MINSATQSDTTMDIDSLEHGPITDGLVALRIMKLSCTCDIDQTYCAIHGEYHTGSLTAWSSDPRAAYEMETEIERQGWANEYAEALWGIVSPNSKGMELDFWFKLAHASPIQRCKAALKAERERVA